MTDTLEHPPAADAPPVTDPRWTALAAPFPPDEIEKLPKQLRKNDEDRYQCRQGVGGVQNGKPFGPSADGYFCGGYHARSIHLDYVGHAGVTTRLNQVDPTWTWEPMYRDVPDHVLLAAINTGNEAIVRQVIENAPMLPTQGGLWIRLTVLGVSRPGFGDAKGKSGPDAIKEIIGDAIRNAAMRFGVATYLWSKSDKARAGGVDADEDAPAQPRQQPRSQPARQQQQQRPPAAGDGEETAAERAIRQRREADQLRYAQLADTADRALAPHPGPGQQQAAEPVPARTPEPRDIDEALGIVEEIVAATTEDRLRALFKPAERLAPGGYATDVRRFLDPAAAPILGLDLTQPVTIKRLLVVAKTHLDAEGGMSIRDHVRAEQAQVGPDGRAVTPPPDAIPATR